LCYVDWKSCTVFPRSCTVKVWNVWLYRSHTTWWWQEGIEFACYLIKVSINYYHLHRQ